MITLTHPNGNSVTINPDRVAYVYECEDGKAQIWFAPPLCLYVNESYLDVVGQLKAQGGGCCR